MTQQQIQDALLALLKSCRTNEDKQHVIAEMMVVAGCLVGFYSVSRHELDGAIEYLLDVMLREAVAAYQARLNAMKKAAQP